MLPENRRRNRRESYEEAATAKAIKPAAKAKPATKNPRAPAIMKPVERGRTTKVAAKAASKPAQGPSMKRG